MPAGPVYSRIKTWVAEVLTAADLNAEFDNILDHQIPTGIDDYSTDVANAQEVVDPGGVGTESLATTLAGEITRLRYAIKRIAGGAQWYSASASSLGTGGIATATLADSAVTAAKIAADAVTTVKILNSNVTTAKIADGAVTQAKRAALGQAITSSSSNFLSNSTTYAGVTNLSQSFTSTGRPVMVILQPQEASGGNISGLTITSNAYLAFYRDSSLLVEWPIEGTGNQRLWGAMSYVDIVGAGTYTYNVQVKNAAGNGFAVDYMKLLVFEL